MWAKRNPFLSRGVTVLLILCAGCGVLVSNDPAPLFGVPLIVNGESVGPAIIDTGGGFEIMLREPFGIPLAGTTEVLAFGGLEMVEVTEGFDYSAGSWSASTRGAIVGISTCECNGVGIEFFRKTGAILEIDFASLDSRFVDSIPQGGVSIPFSISPPQLPGFDTSFITVEASIGGTPTTLVALLDTGATATVMRRSQWTGANAQNVDRVDLTITHPQLGPVTVSASLFDTPDLPDLILGTDVMRTWADRWYFQFDAVGGRVVAVSGDSPTANSARSTAYVVSPQ